jgi:hypothetical protein
MRLDRAVGLVFMIGSALAARPAAALQFDQVPVSANELFIAGRGPIVKDDAMRLEQSLAAIPSTRQVSALTLDSPGGNVVEGELLARLIRMRKLTVIIPANSKCVSACFLLLAASPRRLAASDALIGVHGASEGGEETVAALAVTTRMARDAASLGIPPAVIGKMVQTVAGRVEWLTHADLASMNVSVFDDDMSAALRQTNTQAARQIAPPLPPASGAAFAAGAEDRRGWDAWLAGLRGSYREGAIFAQTQTGLPGPALCADPNGTGRVDFTPGCEAGRQHLAPVEVKLRGDANYAAGWNSAGPPAPPDQPAEAEYQGALFCGRQVARLTLKVLPQSDEPQRRGVVSFGPQPTSPEVPRGSFIVEGSIGLDGGLMSFIPVKWVSQPAGFNWLGLSGNSDDGGKTFGGRIVDNSACTIFTLKRVDDVTAVK